MSNRVRVAIPALGLGLAGVLFYACGGSDSSQPSADAGPWFDVPSTFEGGNPDAGGGASVLMFHKSSARAGLYVDPALTKAAAAGLSLDMTFNATTAGQTQAQPLYVDGISPGKDAVFVATEENNVYAFDAADGSVLWKKTLATPVSLAHLPCGQPTDPHGVMATPIIDFPSRTLFLEAFTTPDNGNTRLHQIFALSIDDGSPRAGWPVDVGASVPSFDATTQNDRGALVIAGGWVYAPYAGLNGDCGSYHGWVVGVPMNNPGGAKGWSTSASGGGIWGAISSDGTNVYVATGNTMGANGNWGGGEAVIRLNSGVSFSGQGADYYAPANWQSLDDSDSDLGSSGPIVLDVPGANPSALLAAMGKDGNLYLVSRTAMGGIGGEVAKKQVMNGAITTAAVTYATSKGTYIVLRGEGGGAGCPNGMGGSLVALAISATSPPGISTAWCADPHGLGNPIVTTSDGHADAVVWVPGAEGDNRLHGYDGDTGATVFKGGGPNEQMGTVRNWSTLIEAKHRLFVAADGRVYAFTTP